MKKIIIILIFFIFIEEIEAQIGINVVKPDSAAAIELYAKDKGLLIPRTQAGQKYSLLTDCSPDCSEGLLIYDQGDNTFFYQRNNAWYFIDPFLISDLSTSSSENIRTHTLTDDINLGGNTSLNYPLNIEGGLRIRNDLDMDGSLSAEGNLTVADESTVHSINVNGTLAVTEKLTGKDYSTDPNDLGNGPIPLNGIVMYFGKDVPEGYVLCDGANGTPDLREKMIIAGGGTLPYGAGTSSGTSEEATASWEDFESSVLEHNHKWCEVYETGYEGRWKFYAYEESGNHVEIFYSDTQAPELDRDCDDAHDDGQYALSSGVQEGYTKSASVKKSRFNTDQIPHTHDFSNPSMQYYVLMFIMKK